MNIKALASGAAGALVVALVATADARQTPPRVTGNLPTPIDLGQTSETNDFDSQGGDGVDQSHPGGTVSGVIPPTSGQTSTAPLPPAAWAGLIGLGVAGIAMRSARKKGYA